MYSKDYFIMIVDDYTVKILFEETCNMYDLIKEKIYHIETISKKRKWYENTDAIYFISPKDESLKILINDFSDKAKI